jgi:hypothetical protein
MRAPGQFASPRVLSSGTLDPHRLHLDLVRAREALEADHALASNRSGGQGTPRGRASRAWREAAQETGALVHRLSSVLAALEAKQGGSPQQ